MCFLLFDLKPFNEKQPPEGTDLFVCGNPSVPGDRTYGIFQFFKKGSRFPDNGCPDDSCREERLLDAIFHLHHSGMPVPETGYYYAESGCQDGTGPAVWLKSAINPLDSSYTVIGPGKRA